MADATPSSTRSDEVAHRPEPVDDLVTTAAHPAHRRPGAALHRHAPAGSSCGRRATPTTPSTARAQGRGVPDRLHARRRRARRPAGDLRVQRRPRLGQRLAAPGPARAAPGGDGRRRRAAAAAVRAARQRGDPARPLRPGLHRPGVDRLLAGGQGREVRRTTTDTPATWSRSARSSGCGPRRNGRWLSPKYLCGESYGTLRAAALAAHLQERYGMDAQRADAHLLGTRPGHPGIRRPQRRSVPALPAHLRGDRALPRPARRPAAGRGARRGRALRRRRLPVRAGPGQPAPRRGARRRGRHHRPADRPGARTTSTGSTCGSSTSGSSPNCSATSAARSAGSTAGSSAGTPTTAGEHWSADPSMDAIIGPVHRRDQPLPARRARVPQRPALRGAHRPGAPVVVQGVRGPARERRGPAGGRHARQPAPAGVRRLPGTTTGPLRTPPPSTPSPTCSSPTSCGATSSSTTSKPAT